MFVQVKNAGSRGGVFQGYILVLTAYLSCSRHLPINFDASLYCNSICYATMLLFYYILLVGDSSYL
jgi:hypothetical protein